jgi:uncharacterized protein YmfQ (DUF2313 family)
MASPPAPPPYTQDDYAGALAALMPRGRAWPTDSTSILQKTLRALAGLPARLSTALAQLLLDAFPATSVNLIADWEASLGLPDPCAGPAPTLSLRQAQCAQRFAGSGGASVPYLIAVAAALGYPVTITEHTGADAHKFTVNAPTISESFFRVGTSRVPEPLVDGGNALLECVINEIKPAHTVVEFNYS